MFIESLDPEYRESPNDFARRFRDEYPKRFKMLEDYTSSVGGSERDLNRMAWSVWYLSQLYLIYLDGDDNDFPKDQEIAANIKILSQSQPRCPIHEEAQAWMAGLCVSMTHFEINLGILSAIDLLGISYIINGEADAVINDLIKHRNLNNPRMIGK